MDNDELEYILDKELILEYILDRELLEELETHDYYIHKAKQQLKQTI